MNRKIPLLLLMGGLLYGARASAQSASFVLTQAPCNANGILTANFTGLTPPLTVNWYTAGGTVTHTGVTSSSDVLTGYAGGPLWIYVQGANTSIDASFGGAPPLTYQASVTNGICPALSTASVVVAGGTAPYTYQWINAATSTVVSTANPAPLPDGNYQVMITDANGCAYGSIYSGQDSMIYVHSEAPFNYTLSKTPANCTNGTATVSAITGSGVPPYTYLWSNGATTASISGLTAGSYSVTVTDANGCTRTKYVSVEQAITIGANITTTPATCTQSDGSLMVFGSGGTPPYSYLYSNGGTTQAQSNLPAGAYTVVVTDANGCFGNGYGYINGSSPVTATYTATASSCTAATGSATLSVSGGQAPYTITWGTFPAQSGTSASNLAPGNYPFHITDANGCVRTGVAAVPPVNIITANVTGTNATCTQTNGSITVTPAGGTAPYAYLWSNGATTATVNSLAAGSYSVAITDASGCSITKFRTVEASSPVNTGLASTATSCIFTTDGSIVATAWGGAAPYTYSWSNGQTTATATGLASGNYWLTVTDANGCVAHDYAHVSTGSGTACYCTITGTVYHDVNGNCIQDPGEPGIPNIQMHCSGNGYAYTNAAGVYTFHVPTGSYTLSETVQAAYPLAGCQSNAVTVNATAATGCTQTYNFANSLNPIHDIHISTWDNTLPVPGNSYSQTCIISNQGTVSESTVLAGYATDGQLNTPSFSPAGVFAGASTWFSTAGNTVPALAPAASQAFSVSYSVPTNIPMGTNLAFRDSAVYNGPMSGWVNDYSPWNNVNQHDAVVVSSYDPNFKQVNPKGIGATGNITHADSVLEYMVHFQNLGTYKAQNVVVIDTLDDNLDWSSVKPIYSSHVSKVEINEHGVMKYTFSNINLPAKMYDEPGSNGMFTYTAKLKPNLPLGTQIWNTAGIYFDYNEPVITNGVVNTLAALSSVNNPAAIERLAFMLYPNPARTGFTTVVDNKQANAATSLTITDVSGRVLLTKTMQLQVGQQLVSVNTEALTAGIYLVSLDVAGKKGTQKLVIVK